MKEKSNKKNKGINIINILNVIVSIGLILGMLFSFKIEHIQMSELGETYNKIFYINLKEKLWIMLVVFITTFLFVILINKILKKEFKKLYIKEKKTDDPIKLPNITVGLVLGLINAIVAQVLFRGKILDLLNIGWFGKNLTNTKLDYNFVMIVSPIIQNMLFYLAITIIAGLIYAFICFLYFVNIKLDGIDSKDLKQSSFVTIFRRFAITILFIALAIFTFRIFDIFSGDMFKKFAPDNTYLTGASKADVTIRFWGNIIFSIVFFILILRINRNVKNGKGMKALKILIMVPVLVLSLNIMIFLYKAVFIGNDTLEKENKYIEKNIRATEEAFNIKLDTKIIEEAEEFNKNDFGNLEQFSNEIPIISEELVLQNLESFKKKDSSFKYMKPSIIADDKTINYFSPRENKDLKVRNIDGKEYVYNHGYFGALTDAKRTDEDGFLMLDEKISEQNFLGGMKITEPRIYYGLTTNKSTVVGPEINEFDYEVINSSKEKEIRMHKYNGKGGKKLNKKESFLFSIYHLDPNIFINGRKKENKILFNRQIIDRAKKVLPQLIYDDNPYLVPNQNGSLSWVIDAYTSSNKYPYSQKILTKNEKGNIGRINYFKNSVKVVIDAYDGTIDFYMMDESDPFAKQIQNKYKNLFKKKEEMPEAIKNNLIYPKKLYDIQAKVIENYHKISQDTLYRSEDIWEVSSVKNGNNKQIKTKYLNLRDNDKQNKISLVTMYTPLNKQNIKGYLTGSVENAENKLTLVKFDQNENFLSLNYMKDKIHEDEKAKIKIDKLNRLGVELLRDTMLVPVNNSILYVEPVYQVHLNEKSVPVLKMVIVANGNKVGIGSNLRSAVSNLFTDQAISINVYDPNNMSLIIDSIISNNKKLKESMKSSNWNYIGKDLDKLTVLIEQLKKAKIKEEQRQNKEQIEKQKTIQNEIKEKTEKQEKVE